MEGKCELSVLHWYSHRKLKNGLGVWKPKSMFLVSLQMHANLLSVRQCTASQMHRNIQVPSLVVPPKIIPQNEENPS